jgi:hypothetical protein
MQRKPENVLYEYGSRNRKDLKIGSTAGGMNRDE